jgi:hypothetical protein
MTNTILHVHGSESEEVRGLVRELEKAGYEAYLLPCSNLATPIVIGPSGEQFKGQEIRKVFLVETTT